MKKIDPISPIGHGSSISLSDASDMFNKFKDMPKKDQKRFAQCFNCANLNTCHRGKESEDENGLCKFYNELPKHKPKDFADIFGNMMLNHVKEDKNV